MKNLLIAVFLFSGVGMTQLAAQSCCTPTPSCCVPAACCVEKPSNGKNAKANVCTPEEMKNCTPEQAAACSATGAGASKGSSLSKVATGKPRKTYSSALVNGTAKATTTRQ